MAVGMSACVHFTVSVTCTELLRLLIIIMELVIQHFIFNLVKFKAMEPVW